MKLLFWNLHKKANENFIINIIRENNIDIAVFSEYENTDFSQVIEAFPGEFDHHDGNGGCMKVTLLARVDYVVEVRRESTRYTLYSIENETLFNIAGIHLPANPEAKPQDRKIIIRELVGDIEEQERELNHENTIVIGDFNANPFDGELVEKDAFNAVLFKQLINRHEIVTHQNRRYKRFYNPMLHYLSENDLNYGSFYYGNGVDSIYWFCFDQVIVRKPLVGEISNVQYCKAINNRSLLSLIKPVKTISDHLPLIVEIGGTQNG